MAIRLAAALVMLLLPLVLVALLLPLPPLITCCECE